MRVNIQQVYCQPVVNANANRSTTVPTTQVRSSVSGVRCDCVASRVCCPNVGIRHNLAFPLLRFGSNQLPKNPVERLLLDLHLGDGELLRFTLLFFRHD